MKFNLNEITAILRNIVRTFSADKIVPHAE